MALSEEEQRLLDQLEASLAAEDPRLAQKFSPPVRTKPSPVRVAVCSGAFALGLACLVGGIPLGWVLSVVGFVVMFASIATLLLSPPTSRVAPEKTAKAKAPAEAGVGFMDRLGERWNERRGSY